MTVGILLVTHEQLGAQLATIAQTICCQETAAIALVEVPANINPQQIGRYADRIRDSMESVDNGSGVLVLTDIFGATPDNLARYFAEQHNALVLSGVNLPMLLRVLNYPGQTLSQLAETALTGGKKGIQQA